LPKHFNSCSFYGNYNYSSTLTLCVDVKKMTEDIAMPNGDFLKNYPDVTRVEVITDTGREFVRYGCSTVQVSLQDDGRTLKVCLSSPLLK
jgi:hypothetical protein